MAISPNKEAMLRALASYKYLTVSHILKLGISSSKEKTAQYFRQLQKDYEFVGRQIHYGLAKNYTGNENIQRTRHEYLRHLTIMGAKFLDSRTELSLPDIRYPKRPNQYLSNDYFHRVSTISMNLSFDSWMKQILNSQSQFLTYYKKRKETKTKGFECETRMQFKGGKHFSPDAICVFKNEGNVWQAFVLEVYNSKGNNRVKYVLEQLEKLFWIIDKTRKIENILGIDAIPRILCTLDSKKFLVAILKRIRKNPFFQVQHIEQLLFFNVDINVWNNFPNNWVNIEGKLFNLTQLQPIQ